MRRTLGRNDLKEQRQLGFFTATALVVANMIGTGVFTTSGFLLADLHSPWIVLLAWLVGGILAGLGALSYGALARRIPESGGEYLFLSRTLHPAAGYIAGWVSLLVGFSAPLAAGAFSFGEYTKTWMPAVDPRLIGTALLVIFCALHALHVPAGAMVQNFTVVLKVMLILVFIIFAATRVPALPPLNSSPFSVSAFGVSLVWISFCYSGWNAAVYLGGEIHDPERNLPRSLLLGTLLVMALYLGLNAAFLFSTSPEQLAGKLEIGRIAAHAVGGPAWANALSGLIALALATMVSAMMMAGPRVYARMAADGYLPRSLIAVSGPPSKAIIFQCAVALALLWSATFESLLTYIGFTLGLGTAATVFGLVRLRMVEGSQLRVVGWPWVPGLFLVGVLATTLFSVARRPVESLFGLGTIALGWLAWRIRVQSARRQVGRRTAPH